MTDMLECRLAISPRPAWLNRVRLIAASLRQFYPDTMVTVSCYPGPPFGGAPMIPNIETIGGYQTDHDGILYRVPRGKDFDQWAGTRSEYLATMMDRYKPPFQGDYLIMTDADVLCLDRFDELFEHNAIQGVQAHVPPANHAGWTRLFHDCGLPSPEFKYQYSGFGIMHQEQWGVFYPNSGVIFGPRALFERLAQPYDEAIETMRGLISDTYWFDQLGLALGVAAAGIPVRSLPLRYNFPNQAEFDAAHPTELAQAKFLHFLRTDTVDRDRDFEDVAAMRRFIARRDLTGSNERLRQRVEELLPIAFPEPAFLERAEDAPYA